MGERTGLDFNGAGCVDRGAEVIGAARDREPRVGANFAMRRDGFFDSDSVAKQCDARSRIGLGDAGHARHELVGKPKRLPELAKALAETAVGLRSVCLRFGLWALCRNTRFRCIGRRGGANRRGSEACGLCRLLFGARGLQVLVEFRADLTNFP